MKIEITDSARRDLQELPSDVRDAVVNVLHDMASDPQRLERTALQLDSEELEAVDLPASVREQAEEGSLKALGIAVTTGRRRVGNEIWVFFVNSIASLRILSVVLKEAAPTV